MHEFPSPALTRRGVLRAGLRAGLGAAVLSALGACESSLASRPRYLMSSLGEPNNFRAHLHARTVSGDLNIGGIDLHFVEGAPLLAIAPGHVHAVGNSAGGGWVTQVDYGTVLYEYAHQLEVFVRPRQRVTRGMIIGREGKTGENAERSHLHITIAGNAAFNHHRYERYGPKYETKNIAAMMNYVLNPDKLTGGSAPLVNSPWDPAVDYDGAYLDYVAAEIVPALLRLADGPGISRSAAGFVRRRAQAASSLNQAINRLWDWRYAEDGGAPRSPETVAALEDLFVKAHRAGNLIRLTSPYIAPGDDTALAAVARANPQHAGLLREYYGSSKLAGAFPRAV